MREPRLQLAHASNTHEQIWRLLSGERAPADQPRAVPELPSADMIGGNFGGEAGSSRIIFSFAALVAGFRASHQNFERIFRVP